jgi:hypothetical protein
MQVADINGVHQAMDIAELESFLTARIEDRFNSFWLRHDDEEFPTLSILVRDNLTVLYYIPQEFEAGFRSVGSSQEVEAGGHTTFSISRNSGDDVVVTNDALIPFREALSAAKEFYCSSSLPGCVNWFGL